MSQSVAYPIWCYSSCSSLTSAFSASSFSAINDLAFFHSRVSAETSSWVRANRLSSFLRFWRASILIIKMTFLVTLGISSPREARPLACQTSLAWLPRQSQLYCIVYWESGRSMCLRGIQSLAGPFAFAGKGSAVSGKPCLSLQATCQWSESTCITAGFVAWCLILPCFVVVSR